MGWGMRPTPSWLTVEVFLVPLLDRIAPCLVVGQFELLSRSRKLKLIHCFKFFLLLYLLIHILLTQISKDRHCTAFAGISTAFVKGGTGPWS